MLEPQESILEPQESILEPQKSIILVSISRTTLSFVSPSVSRSTFERLHAVSRRILDMSDVIAKHVVRPMHTCTWHKVCS